MYFKLGSCISTIFIEYRSIQYSSHTVMNMCVRTIVITTVYSEIFVLLKFFVIKIVMVFHNIQGVKFSRIIYFVYMI